MFAASNKLICYGINVKLVHSPTVDTEQHDMIQPESLCFEGRSSDASWLKNISH